MPKKKQKIENSSQENERMHEESKTCINTKEIALEEIGLICLEYWKAMDCYNSDPHHRTSQKRF